MFANRLSRMICWIMLGVAGAAPGCSRSSSWQPAIPHVQTAPTEMQVDLAKRMPAGPYRSVYRRTSRKHPEFSPLRYVVHALPGIQREGAFAESAIASLDPFVPRDSDDEPDERFTWPRWRKGSAGLMLRFDPAIDYLPQRLDPRAPNESVARLELFNAKGRGIFNGKAERTVELEGYATVTAGGRRYTDCVCVRTTTRVQVPVAASVTLSEYLYLAPGRGMVYRVQRLRGRVLLRFIDDVVEDELVQFEALPADPDHKAPTAWRPSAWSAAILFFQPSLPQPFVAGAIIDYTSAPKD